MAARTLTADELTGTAGGSLTWTGAYDASFARFAWVDPLDDLTADVELAGALPGGPALGSATYLVTGWWSDAELDPLDDVRTSGGLAERTEGLGWRIVTGGGDEHTEPVMLLGLQMTMTSTAIPASFFFLLKSIVFLKAAEEYHLLPDTLYLTVNYIDRFFSDNKINRQRLQLLGVACMLIAA
jgi:hypothetical protein